MKLKYESILEFLISFVLKNTGCAKLYNHSYELTNIAAMNFPENSQENIFLGC